MAKGLEKEEEILERKGKERGRKWGRRKREYKREDGDGTGLQRNEERVVAGGMRQCEECKGTTEGE